MKTGCECRLRAQPFQRTLTITGWRLRRCCRTAGRPACKRGGTGSSLLKPGPAGMLRAVAKARVSSRKRRRGAAEQSTCGPGEATRASVHGLGSSEGGSGVGGSAALGGSGAAWRVLMMLQPTSLLSNRLPSVGSVDTGGLARPSRTTWLRPWSWLASSTPPGRPKRKQATIVAHAVSVGGHRRLRWRPASCARRRRCMEHICRACRKYPECRPKLHNRRSSPCRRAAPSSGAAVFRSATRCQPRR